MARWEYGYLRFHTDESGRRAKLFLPDGESNSYSGEQADLLELLNELGGQGWEAFSHTYDLPLNDDQELQWMSILLKRER